MRDLDKAWADILAIRSHSLRALRSAVTAWLPSPQTGGLACSPQLPGASGTMIRAADYLAVLERVVCDAADAAPGDVSAYPN